MTTERGIGFVGFGEAGSGIAIGLRGAGVARAFAYDINSRAPKLGERIQRRAHETGVSLLGSSESLAAACDILFSTVTADRAAEAAEQTAPFLNPRHLYADLNSVSPATKRNISQIISKTGARFVEAAVMAPVPPHGHRVPMLLGGEAARDFAELFTPFGMRLEVISEEVGAAAAVKMCRSIVIKGLEALLLECALGASRYGADERVFASLDESLPGMNWSKLATYMIGRVVEHGERRAREMDEVAETLRAAGIEPMMTEAASRRQEWGGRLNLLDQFSGRRPVSYREIVLAITDNSGQE